MEQYVTIDIHILKLLDWLLSRRHCQVDWQKKIVQIREKINFAIQDMPEHKGITELLSGTYINYFHCCKIIDILRETEADSRNIFGRYSSKRMKDWNEIIQLYEKSNVYLAEAADLLINLTKYEIPISKKQITKQQQMEQDFIKKESDSIKLEKAAKNELNQLLKELGLEQNILKTNYKTGLLESAKDLSNSHNKIADNVKNLLKAVEHYKKFSEFTQPSAKIDMNLIEYIANNGNTTTFEYLYNKSPTKIILPRIEVEEEMSDENYDVINWGIDDTAIQIDVVSSGDVNDEKDTQPSESINENEIVAKGNEALTILDNISTRTNFINQIHELKSFLKARLYESNLEASLDELSETKATINEMLDMVMNIIKLLNNPTLQHQYNLTHSARYLGETLEKLKQKEGLIERAQAIAEMSKNRAKEAAEEYVALIKKLQLIVKQSKKLQEDICNEISKKYNGRTVILLGGAS